MSKRIIKISQWLFVGITFLLLLYRITLHADTYDEIMNLNIAYRIVLGGIPFYHIQEAYQAGAIFLAPFLWLFVKLTGGTTGIILYSRIVYIAVLVICTILTYRLLRHYLSMGNAFFLSYVIVFFELLSMFYLWYDSLAVIFFLLGDLAIITALEQSKNAKQRFLYFLLAGIAHSCMALAHVALIPMALGIAVLILILVYNYYGKQMSKAIWSVFAYAIFPLTVIAAALIIVIATGNLESVLIYVKDVLVSRGVTTVNFTEILDSVVHSYFDINQYFVLVTLILGFFCLLVLFLPKTFLIFALALVILPIYNQFMLPETSVRGLPNYLSYLALWTPALYFMIKNKNNFDRCLFYIFWLSSLLSVPFIPVFSLTGTYGPVKAWQMCLPGALAVLYYLSRVWSEKIGEARVNICQGFYMIVSCTLLLNAYKYFYLNEPQIQMDDTRITEGIYWGIKVNSKMECMPEIERMVHKYTDGCETILASSGVRSIYLMTDLKPFTKSTESATIFDGDIQRWGRQILYFMSFNDLPDLMFLEPYDLEDIHFMDTLSHYELLETEEIGEHEIFVYREIK